MHVPTTMRDQLLDYLALKQLPRTGWVRSNVENPESVAAHSWGMAILALRLAPKDVDLTKVLSMCLVHDLPEVKVGDLTPHDGVSNKAELEHSAMKELAPYWLPLFEPLFHVCRTLGEQNRPQKRVFRAKLVLQVF